MRRAARRCGLAALLLLACVGAAPAMERGELLFRLGGCASCHSAADGPALAGGDPLVTPLGTFHPPNITPDPATGIGAWSEADFVRAMRHGLSPAGDPYYPAFPFTAYGGMSDADLSALFAHLKTVPPVVRENVPHALRFPASIRAGLWAWRWLFFAEARFRPDPTRDAAWNEGAYLAEAVGHCGECHSPRTFFGFGRVDARHPLAGNPGDLVTARAPDLTRRALGDWSEEDFDTVLTMGMTPDGDFLGGEMAKVVENGTSRLPEAARRALIAYLRGLEG